MEGEGVVLRKHESTYVPARSPLLLKFKASRGDLEALVLSSGTKDIELFLPNGSTFFVPRAHSLCDPVRGDIVTIGFEDFARRGVPSRVKLLRVRSDMSWGEAVRNAKKSGAMLNIPSHEALGVATKPNRYWIGNRGHNMRAFFEKLAKKSNFDPLAPASWYSLIPRSIENIKGVKAITRYFHGSVVKALMHLFPEIGLEAKKFRIVPRSHWRSVANRRNFFVDLARELGFDPFVASNWYTITPNIVKSKKKSRLILGYYGGSFEKALFHLFPEIGLQMRNFTSISHYRNRKLAKSFFTQVAKSQGFDPLVAENWYSVTKEVVSGFRGAVDILQLYKGNFVKALLLAFPNIGLDPAKFGKQTTRSTTNASPSETPVDNKEAEIVITQHGGYIDAVLKMYPEISVDTSKFSLLPRGYWMEPKNRKEFFDTFAKNCGFDSLCAEKWYSVTKQQLMEHKSANSVMHYHGGSFIKALQDLYPSLHLDPNKFSIFPKFYWNDEENRKKFFIGYAQEKGFDPFVPDNWYSITPYIMRNVKGIANVLSHHKGKYEDALIQLFPNIGLNRDKFVG